MTATTNKCQVSAQASSPTPFPRIRHTAVSLLCAPKLPACVQRKWGLCLLFSITKTTWHSLEGRWEGGRKKVRSKRREDERKKERGNWGWGGKCHLLKSPWGHLPSWLALSVTWQPVWSATPSHFPSAASQGRSVLIHRWLGSNYLQNWNGSWATPSSWPGVYRFMLRSLLISEPVTEKDKGPREVTHGDLSYLNLPRPSPQVSPVDQPTLSFPNQAWPSVTESNHGSEHEIWSQAALGSTPRITESKGICIFAVERCCQTAKKAEPIYTLTSGVRQCPFHTFSIFTNLFGKQNKKPSTTVLAFLSLVSFSFFFFHFEFL